MKNNLVSYTGLFIVAVAALFMLIIFIADYVTNTTLAIAGGLGVLGLLVQIFVGRSVDY